MTTQTLQHTTHRTTTHTHAHMPKTSTTAVLSPLMDSRGHRIVIGEAPHMNQEDALVALEAATTSYDKGLGTWALSSLSSRIEAIEKCNEFLLAHRDEIAAHLMLEICKTKEDAYKEIDRTIEYMHKTVDAVLDGSFSHRMPLGVTLLMGPSNYPVNETLTVMLPALLMGNSVILKTPKSGTLATLKIAEGIKDFFPEGVVTVLSGDGAALIPPLIKSEKLDALCFIGGTSTAKRILQENPIPHRLKLILGLGAKNPGIILPDADLKAAAKECVKGALSYNGQRCTALKALFVHRSVADDFAHLVAIEVEALKCGKPWEQGVSITPIEPSSVSYMESLVDNAIATSNARIINKNGGTTRDNLYIPAVLYPVTLEAQIAHHEQFGPVVPIIPFEDKKEVIHWMKHCEFAQQASIFTTNKADHHDLLQAASSIYSRININKQCQRGPDHLPFSASRNSGMGVLSITDALHEFSRPTVIVE